MKSIIYYTFPMSVFARKLQKSNHVLVPTVHLLPVLKTLAPNETVTVSIRENSWATEINATQVDISYPVGLIDYVATVSEVNPDNPYGIIFSGSAFSVAADATVDTNAGTISITRGVGGGGSLVGDQLIAQLVFRAKTVAGIADVTFLTSTALVAAQTSTNILAANGGGLTGATYTISA